MQSDVMSPTETPWSGSLPSLSDLWLSELVDRLREDDSTLALWKPQAGPQTEAVESEADEILYGGEPGGGKTDWLIGQAVTRHVRAQLFRRDAGQLTEITDRLREVTAGAGRVVTSPRPRWKHYQRSIELAGLAHDDDAWKWQGRAADFKGFDELTQFTLMQYLIVSGWTRSTNRNQKTKIGATCNPPTGEDALWVVERWKPWLDPNDPRPARSGEIRWYARIKNVDTECEDGVPFELDGETYYPRSRTFIRARLADNRFLGEDYRRQLDQLPEPMRTIYKNSDFMALMAASHPRQIIPTKWIRAAMDRWTPDRPQLPDGKPVPLTATGLDVAAGGGDRTVKAKRYGNWYDRLVWVPGISTPEAKDSAALVDREMLEGGRIIVDCDGVGGETFGILSERRPDRVVAFRGVRPTMWRDESIAFEFYNVKAAAWWSMRQALDPRRGRQIALPPDDDLLTELAAPRWDFLQRKIIVEKKSAVSSRIGRSPDLADAVVMANWEGINLMAVPDTITIERAS